jgi:methyl-accepting chemotaxis protein
MLTDSLKSAYGIESAVFFDEEILKKMATGANPAIFSVKNRFGNYIKTDSTNWDFVSQIIQVDEINARQEIKPFSRDFEDNHYGIATITLKNIAGAKMGTMVLINDLNIDRQSTRTLCILVCLFSLFGAVLISGLLVTIVKGGILTPLADLSHHFQNLVQDPKNSKTIDPVNFEGAMNSLANSYTKLRVEKHLPENFEKVED